MAAVIYLLCLLTSSGCAALLFTAYRRTQAPLLLWCAACFTGFALHEALVLVDVYVVPDVSLYMVRTITGFVAMTLMLVGLIFHTRGDGP